MRRLQVVCIPLHIPLRRQPTILGTGSASENTVSLVASAAR